MVTYEIRSEKSWITLDLLQRVISSCCQQPSYTIFPVLPYNCEGQLKSNTTANLTACIIRIQRTRDTVHYRQCVVSINYHSITTYLVLPLDLLPSVCPLTTPWRISHTSQLFFLSSLFLITPTACAYFHLLPVFIPHTVQASHFQALTAFNSVGLQ